MELLKYQHLPVRIARAFEKDRLTFFETTSECCEEKAKARKSTQRTIKKTLFYAKTHYSKINTSNKYTLTLTLA